MKKTGFNFYLCMYFFFGNEYLLSSKEKQGENRKKINLKYSKKTSNFKFHYKDTSYIYLLTSLSTIGTLLLLPSLILSPPQSSTANITVVVFYSDGICFSLLPSPTVQFHHHNFYHCQY